MGRTMVRLQGEQGPRGALEVAVSSSRSITSGSCSRPATRRWLICSTSSRSWSASWMRRNSRSSSSARRVSAWSAQRLDRRDAVARPDPGARLCSASSRARSNRTRSRARARPAGSGRGRRPTCSGRRGRPAARDRWRAASSGRRPAAVRRGGRPGPRARAATGRRSRAPRRRRRAAARRARTRRARRRVPGEGGGAVGAAVGDEDPRALAGRGEGREPGHPAGAHDEHPAPEERARGGHDPVERDVGERARRPLAPRPGLAAEVERDLEQPLERPGGARRRGVGEPICTGQRSAAGTCRSDRHSRSW